MGSLLLLIALLLLLFLLAGMYRVFRGPSDADRMMAAQLFGTTAVAVLLVTSFATGLPALIDAALVMALLAAITTIAFVRGETSGGATDDN
ncbi:MULTISPECIES: monovalent cation/H+ antiporter complex subunit F [Ruegeria]|uniref:monovalent cation/H+ antiporter complex subunit F n=1 Tax=Ruegeria TaxID=97050 RepID=UPI00147C22DF|nr:MULTISPECIES: monovalent cation/H+ antiporter complex subunit F [Ruegeria]MBY6082772.1 pH regulation protein F [Ruegeria arenilitoris]UWR08381.1 pH regulation protein F [Ruegeria sp. B32]